MYFTKHKNADKRNVLKVGGGFPTQKYQFIMSKILTL